MTSPVGVLTRCALDAFPDVRLAGICELPWTTLNDACNAVGIDGRDASFAYAGVNHLGWLWQVSAAGRDIVAAYGALRTDDDGFPQRVLIGRLQAIPLKYLRLHYETDAVLAEQRRLARPRGAALSSCSSAPDAYRSADDRAIAAVLSNQHSLVRACRLSTHRIVVRRAGVDPVLPHPETEATPEFAADDVLEIPHRVGTATRARDRKIPVHLRPELNGSSPASASLQTP